MVEHNLMLVTALVALYIWRALRFENQLFAVYNS